MASEGIDYAAVLADLEAKRTAIDAVISGVRQMLNLGAEQGVTPPSGTPERSDHPPTKIQFDSFFRMTIPDAIAKYLEMSRRPQTVSEITKALVDGGLPSTAQNLMANVGSKLSRMKSAGEVANVQGKWGLAVWYPAVRQQQVAVKPKGHKRGRPPKNPTKANASPAPPSKPETEPKPPPSKLTPQQVQRMKELHAAGKNNAEIAKELGIHHLTVWRTLKSKAE